MPSLIRMELLKLRKRPMTWINLVLLLGFLGFGTLLTFLSARNMASDPETVATSEGLINGLLLPNAIPDTLSYAYFIGSILLAILAAASIGGEYGWGTLRPLLSTGVARGRLLAAKGAALLVVAVGYLLATLATGVALGLGVALIEGRDLFGGSVDAAWFGDLGLMLLRTLLLLAAPMLIAFFFAILGRSQAVGIGVALGVLIAEGVATAVLGLLGDWGAAITRLLLGVNSRALTDFNTFGAAPADTIVGQGRALITVAVYAILALVAAYLLFRRRDVRGAA